MALQTIMPLIPCWCLLDGLADCSTPQARYLLAVCCLDLDKLQEAEAALLRQGESQVRMCAKKQNILICSLCTATLAYCDYVLF